MGEIAVGLRIFNWKAADRKLNQFESWLFLYFLNLLHFISLLHPGL